MLHSTIDEAFKSRIHVTLEYKTLSDDYRREIWKNNMDRQNSDRITVTQKARNYTCQDEAVLALKWNGREIRNGEFINLLHPCISSPRNL